MGASTGNVFRDLMKALLSAVSDEEKAFADARFGKVTLRGYVATVAAGTTFSLPLMITDAQFMVTSVKIVPADTLTASDTNYVTLSLVYDDGAGGSETTIASATTQVTGGTGNWTAELPKDLTLSATTANRIVPSGKLVTLKKGSVQGTGSAIPAGSLVLVEGYLV